MPKFKTCRPRGLRFRSLLILAGVFMLAAAFTPRAHAQSVIAYFNFEDAVNGANPDFTSEADQGLGVATTITTDYLLANMATIANGVGVLNRVATDTDTNLHSMGLRRTGQLNEGRHFDIPLFTSTGFFQNMTVSFATNNNGNGYTTVQLFYSTNGGTTFTAGPLVNYDTSLQVISLAVPVGANNAPLLVLRLVFTNGGPGNDLQTTIDNIQVTGTIVPEPATVAGGLLGFLGLCWFQRRRLIRSVRLLRT